MRFGLMRRYIARRNSRPTERLVRRVRDGSRDLEPTADHDRSTALVHRRRAIGLASFVTAIVMLTIAFAIFQYADGGIVSKPDVEDFIRSWGIASAAAAIILMIVHAFIPFPAELVAVANGMLFGVVWGTVLTWIGAMVGAALSFGLARRYGRPFAEAVVAPTHWAAMQSWLAARGVPALLAARLLPVVSFNLINMAAGFGGIGWWTFTWTTGIGVLPMTLGMVLVGAGILQASMWSIMGVLGMVVIVAGAVAWRWRRRRGNPGS